VTNSLSTKGFAAGYFSGVALLAISSGIVLLFGADSSLGKVPSSNSLRIALLRIATSELIPATCFSLQIDHFLRNRRYFLGSLDHLVRCQGQVKTRTASAYRRKLRPLFIQAEYVFLYRLLCRKVVCPVINPSHSPAPVQCTLP
jgi:hypothetical protein